MAATRENVDAPLTSARLTRFCPGSQGRIEWNGPTYHAGYGLVYVNSIDWCTSVKLQRLDTLHGVPGLRVQRQGVPRRGSWAQFTHLP